MKLVGKYLIITMLAFASSFSLSAKEEEASKTHDSDSSITLDFQIYYKVDSIDINPRYLDNPKQIHEIVHYLNNSPKIDSITIYAWASPEGGYAYNKRLSQGRAKAAKDFLLKNSPDSLKLNASMIKISPLAENWEGLIEIVEKEYFRADRAKVLKILYNKKIGDETRKWRLQQLDKGRTWKYLVRRYMPRLRTAKWTCVWAETLIPVPDLPIPSDGLNVVPKGTINRPTIIANKEGHKIPFDIKPADTTKLINDHTLLKDYLNKLHEDKWERIWPAPKPPVAAIDAKKDSLMVVHKGDIIDNRADGKSDITLPYEIDPADTAKMKNAHALIDEYLTKLDEDKWERIWPTPKPPVPALEAQEDSLVVVHGGDIIDNRSASQVDFTSPYEVEHTDSCKITNEHTIFDNYLTRLDEDKWERIWPTPKPPVPALDAQEDSLMAVHGGDIIYTPVPQTCPITSSRLTILAPRTNLLMPGLSIGVEVPIKKNWSVGFNYSYPWFVSSENKWCVEKLSWMLDAKYWFTNDKTEWSDDSKLKGHGIGLYAGLGYYDFQNNVKGAQGEFVDFGVDYTYALPIANDKLRFEFNIGLGFIKTYYRPYTPSSDYEDLIKEPGVKYRSTNFVGPTRAGVSLVYPITVTVKKSPYTKKMERELRKAEKENNKAGGNND